MSKYDSIRFWLAPCPVCGDLEPIAYSEGVAKKVFKKMEPLSCILLMLMDMLWNVKSVALELNIIRFFRMQSVLGMQRK